MHFLSFPEFLSLYDYADFALRVVVASICGGLIGFEREKRYKNAGLRTHIIVAIVASIMMIVSKYGFFDVVSIQGIRLQADASRIAHGVVSAIGFLGAGVIFVKRESIVGLTTAAGLWATVGIGVAIGAGLYFLGIFTTILILVIQKLLHSFHTRSHNKFLGTVSCNITDHNMTIIELRNYVTSLGFTAKEITYAKNKEGQTIVSINSELPTKATMEEILNQIDKDKVLDNVNIYPLF